MKHLLLQPLLLGLLAGIGSAQATHLVGPGGFPQIRDALAAAAAGDVIAVQPGTYAHFTANLGVTITALVPGTVRIEYDPQYQPPGCASSLACILGEGPTRMAPPPGQVLRCVGLEFRPTFLALTSFFFYLRHSVVVTSGTVTFDGCTLHARESDALRVDGARVHLQGCTVEVFGTGVPSAALTATAAAVTAVDCSFRGGPSASVPGPAVRLRSAHLQGSRLQMTGGVQLFGGVHGAALDLDRASAAWISDSTLQSVGCPIVGDGSGGGWLARSLLSPSSGTNCTTLPTGALVGVHVASPLQAGAPFGVDFRAAPQQILALVVSTRLDYVLFPGLTDQPLSIAPASSWPLPAVLTDATGAVSVQWPLPAAAAGLSLYVLAAGLQPNSLALSPPAGGVIR